MECTLYTIAGTFADGTEWRTRNTTSFTEAVRLHDEMVNLALDWLNDGNLRMSGVQVKTFETPVELTHENMARASLLPIVRPA